MSFNGTWASADGSLALIISMQGMMVRSREFNYAGNSYPLRALQRPDARSYVFLMIPVDDPIKYILALRES